MAEHDHRGGAHSPEFALLGFLYKQPTHGYNLHQSLVSELGHVWHISQSQTYNILKRLETQGYISATTVEQEKLPPRQLLHITPAGRRRFEDWLQVSSGSSVRAIRVEFITRLYFAQKYFPDKIQPILDDQTSDIKTAIDRLEASLKTIPAGQPFNRISLELRIRQLHSVHDWLIECRHAFENKS